MQKPTINFIGCGRVGKTLAALFHQNQTASIGSIVNRKLEHSQKSVAFIGAGIPTDSLNNLNPADIYFITTHDDEIEKISQELAKKNILQKNNIIVHCSGALPSAILNSAKKLGCYIASVHPIKSFSDPHKAVRNFVTTQCAIEGDEIAVKILEKLFTEIGAKVFNIKAEDKAFYHVGQVFAHNYFITLHYQAMQCFAAANIDKNIALELINKAILETLENLTTLSHKDALTGPLQRADFSILKNHINVLNEKPRLAAIYKQLGLSTLELTDHSKEAMVMLKKIFSDKIPLF